MKEPEKDVVKKLAQYMQLAYGRVIYRFDLAADQKLSIGQATRNKRLHPVRGYPDLVIMEARGGYHGMALEIKAAHASPWLKDGYTLRKNEHLQEQQDFLDRFSKAGYYATFGVGFEHCIEVIDGYLQEI